HQPPQEMSIQEMEDLKQQYLDEMKCLINSEYHDEIKIAELKENFNGISIEIRKKEKLQQLEQWAKLSTYPLKRFNSFCYDDDDDDDDADYTIAVTPSLLTDELDNSLSMEDENLDTILATESDEFIKSSVENLIPIPSESEGIPENMCDVPFHDNSLPLDVSKDQFEDFFDFNNEFSLIDDDSFSIDNIDYVEASPLDSELVSIEVMEIVISKVGGIDNDILLTIKDDILREKLLNVNLLIVKIEALNDNPTPSFDFKTKSSFTSFSSLLEETNNFDNSLPELETFCFDVGEISSGKPDNSLSIGDEHLDIIPATESDEFIKSSVENLIPIPRKSEGIPEHMCDVPSHDNSPPLDVSTDQVEDLSESNEEFSSIDNLIPIPSESEGIPEHVYDVPYHDNSPPLDVSKDQIEDFSESNKEFYLIDDYSFSIDDIDYVEASPPDTELVSSEQYIVDHPIFNAHNIYLDSQIQLNSTLAKITDQMTSITLLCEMACQVVQKKLEEKKIEEERAAKVKYWKLPVCYDDDDDEERSDSLDDNIIC
nr:hypothetical protein [Tanacetum cinerariifolium]